MWLQVERAHLLQEIIDTLEADGNAYAQKRTLYYQLKDNDKLLAKLRAHGAHVGSDPKVVVSGARRQKSPAKARLS